MHFMDVIIVLFFLILRIVMVKQHFVHVEEVFVLLKYVKNISYLVKATPDIVVHEDIRQKIIF